MSSPLEFLTPRNGAWSHPISGAGKVQTFVRCLDSRTPVRYNAKQMYATGSSIRHLGRWLLVAALIVLASLALARVALGGTAPASVTVVVQPGDSLWSIAAAQYPGADTRERVDAIERLNGLGSPVIVAGETLQLPSS
jgi:LysM repeat protein